MVACTSRYLSVHTCKTFFRFFTARAWSILQFPTLSDPHPHGKCPPSNPPCASHDTKPRHFRFAVLSAFRLPDLNRTSMQPLSARRHALTLRMFLILAYCAGMIGCTDADPFGRDRRKISEKYVLEKSDDTGIKYFLFKENQRSGVGVVEGQILKIGCSKKYIIFYTDRKDDSNTAGWYVLHLDDGRVIGPLSETDIDPEKEFGIKDIVLPQTFFK